MTLATLLLSPEGRISRGPWWLGWGLLYGAVSVVNLLDRFIFVHASQLNILLPVLFVALAWPTYSLHAKRFHDRDKPSSWAVAYVVLQLAGMALLVGGGSQGPISLIGIAILAIIALWIIVELGVLRGSVGANRFGPATV